MAKNSVRQYDPVVANNQDIAGISLAEGVTKPSDVNNIDRTQMGQLAQYLAEMSYPTVGGSADVLTLTPTTALAALANNVVYTGTIATTNATTTPTLNVSALGAKVIRKIAGGADVAVAAGDLPALWPAAFVYSTAANSSGGAWILINPATANGAFATLTSIASASTTDLGTVSSHNANITGTTTITAFGSSASLTFPKYKLKFAGILTLTYNATSLILPGAANIVTAAGDTADADYLGSGNWSISNYVRAVQAPNVGAGYPGGFRNLLLTVTGNTTGTITADGITLYDGSGNPYYASAVSQTNTNSGSGAGGLDTGALATSTWYSVWLIYNPTSNTLSSLISLSSTAPTMPSGYTFKLRVGWWRNAASGGYWRTIQYGRRATIAIGTNPTSPASMGSTGSNITFPTAIALANFVPPTASSIFGHILGSGTSGDRQYVAPDNSYTISNAPVAVVGVATSGAFISQFAFVLESTNIYWGGITTTGTTTIFADGWEDNL